MTDVTVLYNVSWPHIGPTLLVVYLTSMHKSLLTHWSSVWIMHPRVSARGRTLGAGYNNYIQIQSTRLMHWAWKQALLSVAKAAAIISTVDVIRISVSLKLLHSIHLYLCIIIIIYIASVSNRIVSRCFTETLSWKNLPFNRTKPWARTATRPIKGGEEIDEKIDIHLHIH